MKRKIVDFMTFICCLAVSCLSLASCDSELDVQQEYPFTVESMPVVGKIAMVRRWKSVWKLKRREISPEQSIH